MITTRTLSISMLFLAACGGGGEPETSNRPRRGADGGIAGEADSGLPPFPGPRDWLPGTWLDFRSSATLVVDEDGTYEIREGATVLNTGTWGQGELGGLMFDDAFVYFSPNCRVFQLRSRAFYSPDPVDRCSAGHIPLTAEERCLIGEFEIFVEGMPNGVALVNGDDELQRAYSLSPERVRTPSIIGRFEVNAAEIRFIDSTGAAWNTFPKTGSIWESLDDARITPVDPGCVR